MIILPNAAGFVMTYQESLAVGELRKGFAQNSDDMILFLALSPVAPGFQLAPPT